MTKHEIKDVAASVHRRLLNKAREEERPFNELLQYYALERFLYRLSKSPHASDFVLKGALMMLTWEAPLSRPSSDIDVLGLVKNDQSHVVSIIGDICGVDVEPDGIDFDSQNITAQTITDAAEYRGLRIKVPARPGSARVVVQIDIGFGDPVVPDAQIFEYPVLLDLPAPRLKGYSRESFIAEKLESIARFGMLNSRLKDFYDIWLLAERQDFEGEVLSAAVKATFSNRDRAVDVRMLERIKAFASDTTKGTQWHAFCEQNRLKPKLPTLNETARLIIRFIEPVVRAVSQDEYCRGNWPAGGPWKSQDS